MDDLKQLTVAQIKPGDRLLRRDHHWYADADVVVTRKQSKGKTLLWVTPWYSVSPYTTGERLAAEGYTLVERDGAVIGKFFCKYW